MKRGKADAVDRWAVGWVARVLVLLSLLMMFTVPTGLFPIISMASEDGAPIVLHPGAAIIPLSGPSPTPTVAPVVVIPHTPHIGIVAGHWGHDSGAICPDGLQEVTINLDIARRLEALLAQRGWTIDLLQEFDPRLIGYQADALLSIHADSCTVPGKTGFKAVRAAASYIPSTEDRFLDCVVREYALGTDLSFDSNTITFDMTHYHAFYEINRMTPALIIEIGFMLDDRDLLTNRADIVARSLFNGLVCFVEGE